MNPEIRAMFTASAGRYPTKAEQALLRDWAGRVDQRLAALDELRSHEEKIIGDTIDEVMRTYPDFERRYPSGRARATRDITLTLRYCGQAMLRADLKFLEDELLLWMSTMLRGVALTAKFIEDTYVILRRACKNDLSKESFELVRPALELCVSVLPGKREASA